MSLVTKIEERKPGYYMVTLSGRLDGNTYADCEEEIRSLQVTM